MIKNLTLKLLKVYKKYVSPLFGFIFGGSCRFIPTCSDYSYEAIEKYGLIKGIIQSCHRIIRCHPLTRPGYDPVPKKF